MCVFFLGGPVHLSRAGVLREGPLPGGEDRPPFHRGEHGQRHGGPVRDGRRPQRGDLPVQQSSDPYLEDPWTFDALGQLTACLFAY